MRTSRPVTYSYAGGRYLLGYGLDFFGIWARGSSDGPLRMFPRTDEGWTLAWSAFRGLEPAPIRIQRGQPLPQPTRPGDRPLRPGESSIVLATPGRRLVARLVDLVLIAVVVLGILAMTGRLPSGDLTLQEAQRLLPAVWWLLGLSFLYEVPLTAARGQTIGKMALRIRVAALPDGGAPGLSRAFVRWLLPVIANVVPFLSLVLWAPILFDPLRQGIPDKAAGTVVVSIHGVIAGPPAHGDGSG